MYFQVHCNIRPGHLINLVWKFSFKTKPQTLQLTTTHLPWSKTVAPGLSFSNCLCFITTWYVKPLKRIISYSSVMLCSLKEHTVLFIIEFSCQGTLTKASHLSVSWGSRTLTVPNDWNWTQKYIQWKRYLWEQQKKMSRT